MPIVSMGVLLLSLAAKPLPVDALIYSTMPSTNVHAPEMAMDGDPKTSYRTFYGMGDGDSFTVILSRPIKVRSIEVDTGLDHRNVLNAAHLEVSSDGETFKTVAQFDQDGTALAKKLPGEVAWIRVRMNPRRATSHLEISEIKIDSDVPIGKVQRGAGRGFVDTSRTPDLAGWAAKAERQMESFWSDTQALLYTDGFITPNAVHVIYEVGPNVTPVAATGGGVMSVNGDYARKAPDDTGLVVHEAAHVIQSGGSPGWLVEAIADYIRWIKYEPENFTYGIDLEKGTPHEPYRAGAAFIGWLELHYDSRLATKLNEATRFGTYRDALFEKYCGKPIDVLYKEFVAAYVADKANLLKRPIPPGMRPRALPVVSGSSTAVKLAYTAVGATADGATFADTTGFDEGGASFSATLLGEQLKWNGVTFELGPKSGENMIVANGQKIVLTGSHRSLWLLGAAVDGGQREQSVTIEYADGSKVATVQNFSDWYEPSEFPGESIALKMPHRNLSNGTQDPRPFYAYSYGLSLDSSKELKAIVLPRNPNIRLLAISLAD